ncbi:MAG: septation ring formation regulator EzrA [Erysipelotrichaceae bacterium]|nr:septation ring formation regulator EzrA [Erysipelotrichaceae bacterium]
MRMFLSTFGLVSIIVASSIVFIGLVFVIYKFVIEKNNMRRQIAELDRRFEYLHALLIGQDAQYVRRLEIIARTNLIYIEIHTKFLKKFKEVRDKHDAKAQSTINHLKDLRDEKGLNAKRLKEEIIDAKALIDAFDREVNDLNSELLSVVKPEEDCRQISLTHKERFRRIKQEYFAKQNNLSLVSESFEQTFGLIDSLFDQFDKLVECANYDDANLMLPKIDKILDEISNDMSKLPNLCTMVTTYIPDKISSLENAFEIMQRDHFPLEHLCVKSAIREMKDEVNVYTTKIKRFDLKNVDEELNNIVSRIDEFITLFDDEKKARQEFESNNESIYSMVTTIERRFIKLCNTIPEVQKIYVVNDVQQTNINNIHNSINRLGALKRSLDTYIHSATKQPYSMLVSKMRELKTASDEVIASMDDFMKYIASLKNDSEEAFKHVYEGFYKVKEIERTLRKIDIEKIDAKYHEVVERYYDYLKEVNVLLKTKPINVEKINNDIVEMTKIENEYFGKGLIGSTYNMMVLATNSIVYANRDRGNFADINDLINQAENMYYEGEFEQSYRVSGSSLAKINNHHAKK